MFLLLVGERLERGEIDMQLVPWLAQIQTCRDNNVFGQCKFSLALNLCNMGEKKRDMVVVEVDAWAWRSIGNCLGDCISVKTKPRMYNAKWIW